MRLYLGRSRRSHCEQLLAGQTTRIFIMEAVQLPRTWLGRRIVSPIITRSPAGPLLTTYLWNCELCAWVLPGWSVYTRMGLPTQTPHDDEH